MKQLKKLKDFGLMAMLISMVIRASSCSDDDMGGRGLCYGKVPELETLIHAVVFRVVMLIVGITVFEKLKRHFAEAL